MRKFLAGLLLAVGVSAGSIDAAESVETAGWNSFEGVWESSYGHLFFTYRTSQAEIPSSDAGRGIRAAFWSYPDSNGMADNGRIIATVNGHTLSGYWVQDSGDNPCEEERDGSLYWGIVRFEANEDFSAIEGAWGLCGQEPAGDDIDWVLWRDELRNWDPAHGG